MPFKYTRKTTRESWYLENMKRALNAVKGGLGKRRAAKMYDIPYITLQDRLRGKVPINKKILDKSIVLTAEQEKELNDYVLEMSKLFYGLTRQQIMKLAFQYTTVNNKNILLRKPEPTSLNIITVFNAKKVAVFFLILQKNKRNSTFRQTEYTMLTKQPSLMYMFLDKYLLSKAKNKLVLLAVVKEVR